VLHTEAEEDEVICDVEEKNGTIETFFIHLSDFHLNDSCAPANPPPQTHPLASPPPPCSMWVLGRGEGFKRIFYLIVVR
jgi:hypothetical protein